MYKIGMFAHICQVSVQTLRYYERLGLIEPQHTDPITNYRYYTLKQVEQVHRIIALKELGLSLEQIRDLIFEDITASQVVIMLKLKRAEIENTIESAQKNLNHINFHLRLLEQENKLIDYNLVVKPIDPLRVLSYTASYQTDQDACERFQHAGKSLKTSGAPLKYDYAMTISEHKYGRCLSDLEIAFPVTDNYEGEIKVDNDVVFTIRDVPATESALTLMHKGGSEGRNGLQETVRLAYMWMAQNDYEPIPSVRVHYLVIDDDMPSEDHLRQIQIPVRKTS